MVAILMIQFMNYNYESKYMSVSGTSIGKFNIVFNISVETLRSFTYFVLTSVSTCRRFNIMLSDI
jgi:hypothetical protein